MCILWIVSQVAKVYSEFKFSSSFISVDWKVYCSLLEASAASAAWSCIALRLSLDARLMEGYKNNERNRMNWQAASGRDAIALRASFGVRLGKQTCRSDRNIDTEKQEIFNVNGRPFIFLSFLHAMRKQKKRSWCTQSACVCFFFLLRSSCKFSFCETTRKGNTHINKAPKFILWLCLSCLRRATCYELPCLIKRSTGCERAQSQSRINCIYGEISVCIWSSCIIGFYEMKRTKYAGKNNIYNEG